MKGSIVKRSRTYWALVVDLGRDANGKRRQRWHKFAVPPDKTEKQADKLAQVALRKLLHQLDTNTYIDASKTTLIEYLRDWHTKVVIPLRRPETARVYRTMIEHHVSKSQIAVMPLQKLRALDLEAFYATLKLSASSVTVLHAVIHRALKTAVRDKVLAVNVAAAVNERPRPSKDVAVGARLHCWSADDARAVLAAAKELGTQASAFYALAIDSGARKSELLGLVWLDVDLDAGTVLIARQLDTDAPTWGPTKTKRARTVTLGTETIARLRAHRKAQRELMMANRTTYEDHGLVFAKQPEHLQTPAAKLGHPCHALVEGAFTAITRAAAVKAIKFHGLRHTAATLLLQAGVPVQVVAQRLGHAQISMTLEVYAHALPDMQRDAAAKLGALLAGR